MLALRRRDSGSEKEGEDALWDRLQSHEGVSTPDSIEHLQHFIHKSTRQGVSTAKDQNRSVIKPNEVQPETSQGEQQQPPLQDPIRQSTAPSQKTTSWPVTPSDSLQDGQPETSCQSSLAPSGPAKAGSPSNQAQTYAKIEKSQGERAGKVETHVEHLSNSNQTQMHGESLHGTLGRSLAIGSQVSFRKRKPHPWPNPQDSLGEMIRTTNKKIKGKAWIAEGPALDLFEAQIRPKIENLLHDIEPPQCAPIFLSIYMIGKADATANPIVMICCCDRKARKDAEALIRESDILQQFPQVGLGNSSSLLETTAFVIPVTGKSPATQMGRQSPTSFDIHASGEPIIGRRLRFVKITDGRATVRFATGGPFIRIGEKTYQLTAYHTGQEDTGADSAAQFDSDTDDCEYDGQSDTDDDDGQFEGDTTMKESPKETSDSPLASESASLSMDISSKKVVQQNLWTALDMSDVNQILLSRRKIDYFLVRLLAGEARKASNAIEKVGDHDALQATDIAAMPKPGTQVVVITSYSHIHGSILLGIQRAKMQGFYGFQNLIAARLSSSIKTGDSGSAVFDANTGCFYGHVVMGSAPDSIIYIVPSVDTFTHISEMFGESPTLDIRSSFLNEEIPPTGLQREQDRMIVTKSLLEEMNKYADRKLRLYQSAT
ncbi:hypothetical protein J7T55_014483 [Diaporthe amygdali]|uniref:uncharacterized protein n=1 Tax=Phomopsis amygdali TaxID=1214568 RepID=UPI0022FED16B|nr:uncharacterized protein J7T55_014483 [Diaporthe amygdali]KAJ0118030.1 hypothetical protein J7T55_014483 [Diaporthe amygdali]